MLTNPCWPFVAKYQRSIYSVACFVLLFLPGKAQLNGSYTIGGTAPDYPTITAAVAALTSVGVNGYVTFNIRPGTYDEHVVIPAIAGASATNRITFQSATLDSSSVIMQYNATTVANNYVIHLNGADYVMIKGITIFPQNATYQIGLLVGNGSTNNTLSNNLFKATHTGTTENKALIYMYGSGMDYNTITKNRFEQGGYQIYIGGSNYTNYITSNNITENTFQGTAGASIVVSYQNRIVIAKNVIEGVRNYSPFYAIYINRCNNSIVIEKNKINITGTTPSAIKIDNSNGTSSQLIMLRNNFVTVTGSSNATPLDIANSKYARIYNNSFHAVGNVNSNYGVVALGPLLEYVQIRNNIFSNQSGGRIFTSLYPYDTDDIISDYNAFFGIGKVIFKAGETEYSLAQWKMYHGQEANSVFASPQFVSNSDLHINNAPALNQAGVALPQITDDIDGQPRNATAPDIGADEYDLNLSTFYDLGITHIVSPDTNSCQPTNAITVRLTNNSAVPTQSVHIKWWLFGSMQTSTVYTLAIPPGGSVDQTIATFDFLPNTLYQIKVEATLLNGQADQVAANNSLGTSYSYLGSPGIASKKADALCGNDTELFIKNFPRETVLWSTGSNQNSITVNSPGTYSVTVTKDGCTATNSITIN